jgi:hypothetical protein
LANLCLKTFENLEAKAKIFLKQKRTFLGSQLFLHFSSMRGTIKSLKKEKS